MNQQLELAETVGRIAGESPEKIWFTADQHFGHSRIINYAQRNHDNVEEMDEALIACWNAHVCESDWVIHLGDFTLGSRAASYLRRLNGRKIFLGMWWHHDRRWLPDDIGYSPHLDITVTLPMMVIRPYRTPPLTLTHYPLRSWEAMHYGGIHLHGHTHELDNQGGSFNVGVDAAYSIFGMYSPFSFKYIEYYMERNGWW